MSIVRRKRKGFGYAYQVRVSVRGKRLPAETFDRLQDAKARERDLLRQHERFSFSRETCRSFADRWPDDYPVVKTGPTRGRRKTEGTVRANREALKQLVAEFGHLALADFDRPTARRVAVAHPRTAAVARGMFQDAVNDGLLAANPFAKLQMEQSPGRRDHAPLTEEEIARLAQVARDEYGPAYGPVFAAQIVFCAYVGVRLEESILLERDWVDLSAGEVHVRRAKLDKPRAVLVLDEAARAVAPLLKRLSPTHERAFYAKRGQPLTKSSHFAIWNPVRLAFWAGLSEQRRRELVDLDWHGLRHFCGHLFYVTLGMSDELTAAQLGHSDAKLVRDTYGHGRHDALRRMKDHVVRRRAFRFERATSPDIATENTA